MGYVEELLEQWLDLDEDEIARCAQMIRQAAWLDEEQR